MPILDWPFFDALQLGALATLFITFGTGALDRRDRMMGWLALACLRVGLRPGGADRRDENGNGAVAQLGARHCLSHG